MRPPSKSSARIPKRCMVLVSGSRIGTPTAVRCSCPESKGILQVDARALECYLDTVEVWRSSRHGPTTVFKNSQRAKSAIASLPFAAFPLPVHVPEIEPRFAPNLCGLVRTSGV
jgi:hypothetical protein